MVNFLLVISKRQKKLDPVIISVFLDLAALVWGPTVGAGLGNSAKPELHSP